MTEDSVLVELSADERERVANLEHLQEWYTIRLARQFEFLRWLYLNEPSPDDRLEPRVLV